jgi:hypothetical protein
MEKKGIRNGCLYTVESIDPAAETLKLEGLDGELSFDQAKTCLRLSWAQTYASCQGSEFGGSLRLWTARTSSSLSGTYSSACPAPEQMRR